MIGVHMAPIGSFCQIGSGTTPSRSAAERYYGGGIPWVKSGELRETDIERTEETITEEALKETSLKLIPAGALLVAMYGATVGRTGILRTNATTNQAICHIIPDKNVADTRYLFFALNYLQPLLVSQSVGGAQPNISQDIIRRTEIRLPPLDEQRRIAAILDQADDLRRKRREGVLRLERLYFASFTEMFGDPTTNSKEWPSNKNLGDVAEIVSGVTKGRKLNGAATRAVPYLAVVNVQDRALNLEPVKTIEATESEIARYKLAEDDLVLTEGGDPDKLGRGALWQNEIAECIHQNHIFRVRLAADVANPIFINWLIGGPRGKAYFLRNAKQTTGIASINMTQLRGFPLILPPIDLQRAFAVRVAEIDKLKALHRAHLAKLDALFASLQHRAFRGEL